MTNWPIIALFLAVVNLMCFFAWAIDKERAQRRAARVPERNMLLLAACGGIGGALLGQLYFRHKWRKRQFTGRLYTILLFEGLILFWLYLQA